MNAYELISKVEENLAAKGIYSEHTLKVIEALAEEVRIAFQQHNTSVSILGLGSFVLLTDRDKAPILRFRKSPIFREVELKLSANSKV